MITRGDVMRALDRDPSGGIAVLDAGSQNVLVTYPDEGLKLQKNCCGITLDGFRSSSVTIKRT